MKCPTHFRIGRLYCKWNPDNYSEALKLHNFTQLLNILRNSLECVFTFRYSVFKQYSKQFSFQTEQCIIYIHVHFSLWIHFSVSFLFLSVTFVRCILHLYSKTIITKSVVYRNYYFINEEKYLMQTFQKPRWNKEAKYFLASTTCHEFLTILDRQKWPFPIHHVLSTVIYTPPVLLLMHGWMWYIMISNHDSVPSILLCLHSVLCDELV